MQQARDMTKAEFQAALERGGFKAEGFMGYYRLPIPDLHTCVSIFNAGERRRDQIAYLHAKLRERKNVRSQDRT